MRTQLSKIALAASFGLAITFTLSCSSDNIGDASGDNPGSNLSNLPTQAYLANRYDDKEEYKGNGDITLRIYLDDDRYVSKPAGRIQNGQVSLSLPDIESKYLRELKRPCNESYLECNVYVIPENILYFRTYGFYVAIPGENDEHCLIAVLTKDGFIDGEIDGQGFYYLSQSGKITGTSRYNSRPKDGWDNYDWNFSKGWNVRYWYYDDEDIHHITSNLSKTGGKLEWWIGDNCD